MIVFIVYLLSTCVAVICIFDMPRDPLFGLCIHVSFILLPTEKVGMLISIGNLKEFMQDS